MCLLFVFSFFLSPGACCGSTWAAGEAGASWLPLWSGSGKGIDLSKRSQSPVIFSAAMKPRLGSTCELLKLKGPTWRSGQNNRRGCVCGLLRNGSVRWVRGACMASAHISCGHIQETDEGDHSTDNRRGPAEMVWGRWGRGCGQGTGSEAFSLFSPHFGT